MVFCFVSCFLRAPDVLWTFLPAWNGPLRPARSRCIAAIKLTEKKQSCLCCFRKFGLLALLDTRVPNRLRQFDELEGAVPSTRLAANCMFRNEAVKVKTHKREFHSLRFLFLPPHHPPTPPPSGRSVKVFCRKLYLRGFIFLKCEPLNDDRPLNFIPHGGGGRMEGWGGLGRLGGRGARSGRPHSPCPF